MMAMQRVGVKSVMIPVSVATNATATGQIDTLGYDEVKIIFHLDTAASTSNNPTTMKLSEADDSAAASNFATITGFDGDATDGFVIPNVSASLATIVEFNVDLRARKRYLRTTLCAGTAAQIMGVTAVLSRAEQTSAAAALAAKVVNG
jgi:hypothetical protein